MEPRHWQAVPPSAVVQESSLSLSITLEVAGRALVLAYLWQETPVRWLLPPPWSREYLGAPLYSLPPHVLPAPPWKRVLPPL